MIIAVQRLKEMSRAGGSLAKWCILWYVGTTFVALLPSVLLASLVWAKLYVVADASSLEVAAGDRAMVAEREKLEVYQVVQNLFDSFVSNNIVSSLASNALLAVIIIATVVGYLIKGELSHPHIEYDSTCSSPQAPRLSFTKPSSKSTQWSHPSSHSSSSSLPSVSFSSFSPISCVSTWPLSANHSVSTLARV